MSAIVRKVVKVEAHPNPEKPHLGLFTLSNGAVCIGVNNEDGSRRFNVDDLVVHINPGSVIPQWLINSGFENLAEKKGKVKAEKFSGVVSEGIMLNVLRQSNPVDLLYHIIFNNKIEDSTVVTLDQDVTEFLGVK